ncbi:MAG TPA: DinB family protein [Gemmatimonadaceae bacterium]
MSRFPWYVAVAGCFAWSAASAQQQPVVSITAPLDSQYAGALTALHDKVVALANAIPADKYSWRPAEPVRTVSQLLMHIAGEWFYLCPLSVASKPPADFGPPGEATRKLESITAKTDVLAQLDKSWAYCRASLDAANPAKLVPDSLPAKMGFPRVVMLVSADQHEHLGQLITYARSVGVVPPWSK